MKTQKIILSIIFFFGLFSISLAQKATLSNVKKQTVAVWGNCGMCKQNIERAALSGGASTADWDMDNHVLAVSYAPSKSSMEKIEQAVAAKGYDTKNFTAPEEAYRKLHSCCQYERKAVNIQVLPKDSTSKMACCNNSSCCGDKDCCKDKKCCSNDTCCKSQSGASCCDMEKQVTKTADCCDGKSCKKTTI